MADLPTGTVTFLFTDLERSTRLWEEQPEAMQAVLARHDALLGEAVASHSGVVIKGTGDGVHAVFATADDAVAAAIAAQRALGAEAWGQVGPLRVRMGLHTGVAEERDGDYFGPVLNRAACLMGVAHGGQVLCSQATADLVRDALVAPAGLVDLGAHQLRDLERPEVVFQVTHPDLVATFPPLATAPTHAGNLPRQVTSFVGREDDLVAITAALDDTPIVTLTGVGGVGKTRLGIEVATRSASRFRDGAWLCELAGIREADAVSGAVLEMFGVEPRQGLSVEDALAQFLVAKELLLVLDNCEHVLRPVARLVDGIVRGCGGVRLLATSREGLGVAGERIVAVTSLDVPDGARDVDEIGASEAVRLFVERAQAVRAGFALDAGNAAAIGEVCRRLDGVPLALELAAARVAMLTPGELAQRLDERFRVLTGSERGTVERHQTLRAAIDWSYEMLSTAERRVLDRLSVFVGGFSLAAAEAVTAGGEVEADDVFELLAALVARSLVQADAPGSETRYRLLETIRQYAQEHLAGAGETETVRAAHAHWCAVFVEDAAAGTLTTEQPMWLERTAREVDNVRAALAWAIETEDVDTLLRFFTCQTTWFGPNELSLRIQDVAPRVAMLPGVRDDPRFPLVLAEAAFVAAQRGDLEEMRYYRAALDSCETPRDAEAAARIEWLLTQVAGAEGQVDLWIEHAERAVALLREQPGSPKLAGALSNLALGRTLAGTDLEQAVAETDEALSIVERGELRSALVLGSAAFVLADLQPERARALMRGSLEAHKGRFGIGLLHSMLADVAERLGDRRLALEFWIDGATETEWAGLSELLGRNLRRIGLLLLDTDPEIAAVLLGAGLKRSAASRLTARVIDAQDRGIAELDAALGVERTRELLTRGESIDDRTALDLALTAAARVLADESTADSRE